MVNLPIRDHVRPVLYRCACGNEQLLWWSPLSAEPTPDTYDVGAHPSGPIEDGSRVLCVGVHVWAGLDDPDHIAEEERLPDADL